MLNYDNKYLKYKKKYIDLKNEYFGGENSRDIIFLYDNTNEIVKNIFQKIKDDYKANLQLTNVDFNKPFIINTNLFQELNSALNIFTYTLGDNKIKPYFHYNFKNIQKYTASRRMQFLIKPFEKTILKYQKNSSFNFGDKSQELTIKNFTCETLKLQLNKIIEFINSKDIINNSERIRSIKTLLELVYLHQNLTPDDDKLIQQTRIGLYSRVAVKSGGNITPPSGTTTTIELKPENEIKSLEIISSELNSNTKSKSDLSDLNYNLNINEFTFNNINDMIHFKIQKVHGKSQIRVINIFESPQ